MENHELEEQFLQLVSIVDRMQKKMIEDNQVLVRANQSLIEWTHTLERDLNDYKMNAPYEIEAMLREQQSDNWFPHIDALDNTLRRIVEDGCSLARFGDGEFATIGGEVRHRFQNKVDEGLGKRLREVLASEEESLLIGIADNFGSLQAYSEATRREIRNYLKPEIRRAWLQLLRQDKIYANAYLTRPYIIYEDQSQTSMRFDALKKIWNGRDCVIVEGSQTRMGVGNDLLDNASDIVRILAPAENAFDCYGAILDECRHCSKDKLFLIALEPTAAVLAYDLCRLGYQAIDIGHIDLEYEWFLRGQGHEHLFLENIIMNIRMAMLLRILQMTNTVNQL